MTKTDISPEESYSLGFDRGNYGNAYESQDWDSWYADNFETPEGMDRSAYQSGLLLGFFSSYEIHEISDDMAAEEVTSLRKIYGGESSDFEATP
jgi:hypothetical protein